MIRRFSDIVAFESDISACFTLVRACSSVVERSIHIREVHGSNPCGPTSYGFLFRKRTHFVREVFLHKKPKLCIVLNVRLIYTLLMEKPISDETAKPEIIVEPATIDDEIRRVRHNIVSFETITNETQNVVMPKGLDVNHKSNLQDAEKLTREEYDPTFYLVGLERVQATLPKILGSIETLRQFQQAWGFELEDSYRIVLTRYGTGGSYDTSIREVIMRTTRQGEFERSNPAATPVHEITHLCVEHLVEKYGLSFSEKERLVNGIDITVFPEIFDPHNKVSETERHSRLAMLSTLPTVIDQMHTKK